MPKCSCAGSACNCLVTAGTGIKVEGTGNATAPYKISVSAVVTERNVAADEALDLTYSETGSVVHLGLDADITEVTLPIDGALIEVIVRHATAGTTVTWPTGILWPGGAEPAQSTVAGHIDWFLFRRAGADWIGTLVAGDIF